MFRLFDEPQENTSIKEINQKLLSTTYTEFPALNTTELEVRQSRAFKMLENIGIDNAKFDVKYNHIMAGVIIYALAFETTKYHNTAYGYLYPLDMSKLFDTCRIPDGKLTYEELILVLANKALDEKVIPFDENTVNRYFDCFINNEKNPLQNILLKRFASTDKEFLKSCSIADLEHDNREIDCKLF